MNLNSLNIKAALGVMMVCIAGLCASPAHAATITVTASAPDVLNGANASCALREAITNINNGALTYADCANTGAAYGTSDTINLPAGTYTNAISGADEFLNATGSLDILTSVTITGAGAGSTIIDGGGAGISDRALYIESAITVSISGITIQNGRNPATGSGFYNRGTTTIASSIITGNSSLGVAGGIENNAGFLTITDSTVSGNTAVNNAGGILNTSGTVTITNSTISGNTATANGGGIFNSGTVTVTNSTITGNTASQGGGGIFNNAGTATFTSSTITGNTAGSTGGGIENWGGTVIVANSTITSNTALAGGGIYNSNIATVTNSTIVRNIALPGQVGGIFHNVGTATVTNSIVADNGVGTDCLGAISNGGGNIDQDSTCAGFTHTATMVQGTEFSALASNGGTTQTHALLAGSAAIDAGDNAICAAAPVSNASQNGITRPSDGDGNGTATCDIGAYEAPDTIPAAFSFTAQTGVALSTPTTSNTITVSGINAASPISIVGGTYSINGGGYTAVAGTANNGDTVTLKQTSSAGYSTLITATLTIGGVSGTFDVTTLAIDTNPDAFSFTAQTGVALSTVATSNTITVSGINAASPISIVGGTYSINGGAYTAVAGTVNNGNTVTLQQTSSASYSTLTTVTLTIGGVSGAFNVTTLAPPAVVTSYTAPSATGTGVIAASFTGGGAGCGYTVSQYIPLTGHAASPPAGSAPAGVSFPHGLFDFATGGCAAASTITLTITYPQALPAGAAYWKYGPTPSDSAPHWYALPATIAGNTATFSITDGGLGDDDLVANGAIVDQGGPGAGGGAAGIPTLSEWGVILLAGMLVVFGMAGVRRGM